MKSPAKVGIAEARERPLAIEPSLFVDCPSAGTHFADMGNDIHRVAIWPEAISAKVAHFGPIRRYHARPGAQTFYDGHRHPQRSSRGHGIEEHRGTSQQLKNLRPRQVDSNRWRSLERRRHPRHVVRYMLKTV